MAQGSKYPDDFAAQVLAEADLGSDQSEVWKRHGIPRSTYFEWKLRAESDKKFGQLRTQKRIELEREWKRFALTSLREAFRKSQELIAKCDQPEHLEYLNAHIKTVGELAVNIEVLNDFDDSQTTTAESYTSSPQSTRA